MNIGDLEIFTAVARERSFVNAARGSYISQSAVSQRIRKMEKELGFPLFSRDSHGVHLTEKGSIMMDAAETILKCYSSALAACGSTGAHDRKLRISYVGTQNMSVLPEILEAFRARRPDCEVVTARILPREVVPALEMHRTDLAITPAYIFPDGSGFETFPLYTDRHYCVMNAANPLSGRPALTPRDLAGHDILAPAGSACPAHMKPVLEALRANGLHAAIKDGHSADNVLIRLMSDKDSIALMPGYTVSAHKKLAAVPFEDGVAIPVVCACIGPLSDPGREFTEIAGAMLAGERNPADAG